MPKKHDLPKSAGSTINAQIPLQPIQLSQYTTPLHKPKKPQHMTTPDESKPATPLIRTTTMVLCVICALSALPWIWMSISHFGGFAWGLFGFELIVLFGCLMTMLVCIGKMKVGMAFPMAIACLIGTILVSAVFGLYVDARAVVGDNPTIGPWVIRTVMFRMGVIGLLCLLATLDVYRRDARSWGLVIRSAIFLLPVLAAAGWIKFKGMPAVNDSSGEPSPVMMVVILLAGLIFGILLSIGGHFLIRSFEIALPEPNPDPQPDKTNKKPA